jgi:hypothetical protein
MVVLDASAQDGRSDILMRYRLCSPSRRGIVRSTMTAAADRLVENDSLLRES